MIELKLTADTAEELRNQLIILIGTPFTERQPYPGSDRVPVIQESTNDTEDGNAIVKQLLEERKATPDKPKTRSRTAVQPAVTSETYTAPELKDVTVTQDAPATLQKDPLENTITNPNAVSTNPTDDLLGSSIFTPTTSTLLDTTVAPTTPDGIPTLEQLKHKIASNNNKQAIRDLIKSGYVKADGTPCYGPSDVQEKDYADFWSKLDAL